MTAPLQANESQLQLMLRLIRKTFMFQLSCREWKKNEINIEYKDGVLTVSGEKKAEKTEDEKGWHYREISYGKFSRSVNVGDVNFEKGKADYENGVLKIELPKAEEAKPHRLQIK